MTLIPDDFGAGGRGLSPQGAHGEPDLLSLLRQPARIGVAPVDFSGAAANAETIQIGTETWTKVAAETNAFEFDGGTANAQAVSLGAAINADSLFLIAVVVTDTVFMFGKNPGDGVTGSLVAGNLTITNGLANTTAPATMEHAAKAARIEQASFVHVPNASEVAAGEIHLPLPFVPVAWSVEVYVTATGAVKDTAGERFDGPITVGTVPDRLIIGQGTTTAWAATDTLHVVVRDDGLA